MVAAAQVVDVLDQTAPTAPVVLRPVAARSDTAEVVGSTRAVSREGVAAVAVAVRGRGAYTSSERQWRPGRGTTLGQC